MKRNIYFIFLIINLITIHAERQPTVRLDITEIDAIFLKNNLELIAAGFAIDIADAAISQAKLWENPNLSVNDLNLWSTNSQREGEREVIPPLFGSFGRNTEFSIELTQLIQTANKRGKLVKREKVSKEMAIQEFEETLRNLKVELRKSVYETIYSQSYLSILEEQRESVSRLIEAYKKQVQEGNIAKNELLRLQSSFIELENEINEIREELNEQEKTLKILLNLDPTIKLEIIDDTETAKDPSGISLGDLLKTAEEYRPDMKWYNLQTQYHQRVLAYEKSLRVPDLTIGAGYDRYGGVWKDFVGFGISIDLPFFNRNQGNVRAAKAGREQSIYLAQQQENIIRNEVAGVYNNYINAYTFYRNINDESLFPELDSMLEVYRKNLLNRNISMLEYIDFAEAYKTNKQTLLNARKKVKIQFEELQYIIGTDIK